MIRFTLTEPQADQILNALGQMPFLQVNGLINELLKQVHSQREERQKQQVTSGVMVPPNGAYNQELVEGAPGAL